jgi:hypothetical protein
VVESVGYKVKLDCVAILCHYVMNAITEVMSRLKAVFVYGCYFRCLLDHPPPGGWGPVSTENYIIEIGYRSKLNTFCDI